jgi:hypothetical protein
MKTYIGIDIGKKGSIVVLSPEGIQTHPMPMIKDELAYSDLFDLLQHIQMTEVAKTGGNPHVVFEKLGVIFGSSKVTAFSMGYQSGAIEMMAIALGIPYTKVPAKQWQKDMFQGIDVIKKTGKSSNDTKAMALIAAKRLFPNQKLTFGEKATKPHDGLVDALLMAEYAKRKNL